VPISAHAAPNEANADMEVSATASDAPAAPSANPALAPSSEPANPSSPTPAAPGNPVQPTPGDATAKAPAVIATVPSGNAAPSAATTTQVAVPAAPSAVPTASEAKILQSLTEGYKVSGYFQAQYESHQDSDDQLRQGGALMNQNRFLLRRGRVRIARDWDYASLLVEMDGNTVRGPAFRWQKAEVSLVYGRSGEKGVDPIVQFTMGMFDLPFGYELVESPRLRPFMERTTGGRALWPSEPDVGARLSGQLKFFRYAVSVTNGEPLDEKSGFGLQDPNKNKDVTVRLGAVAKPWDKVKISGDITYNAGKGFHAGTDATKTTVSWQDYNHDGVVAVSELVPNPGSTATPSMNFNRWAVGADAQLSVETPIGKSMLYGEVIAAQNMDRGLFIADPIATGQNIRHILYYIALVQEVTPYALVGFRTDYYNPNADFLDQHAGQLLPASQAIRNYSPLIGFALPDRARLLLQYDIQSNLLGRDSRGVPTRYPNNLWTLRLQVTL
jgi:hypothetical protein